MNDDTEKSVEDTFSEDIPSPLPLIPEEQDIQDMKRKTSIFKLYSQRPGGKTRRKSSRLYVRLSICFFLCALLVLIESGINDAAVYRVGT